MFVWGKLNDYFFVSRNARRTAGRSLTGSTADGSQIKEKENRLKSVKQSSFLHNILLCRCQKNPGHNHNEKKNRGCE